MAELTIKLRASGARITCKQQSGSLLDTLEANDVNVEFQCREGYCGSCRTRLLNGEVRYAEPPLAYVQPGEILPCCCQPQSDIEIDL